MTTSPQPNLETTTLAGGCFWCLEAVFDNLQGVVDVVSGYAGGHVDNPTYRHICTGTTGHAEVVQIRFDPAVISFRQLLDVFFAIHDPTTRDRQGHDIGPQYRSAIFYHSEAQQQAAAEAIRQLDASGEWKNRLVTEVAPITKFFPAEDYHQEYFANNAYQPYCQAVIAPKLAKFRKLFKDRVKT